VSNGWKIALNEAARLPCPHAPGRNYLLGYEILIEYILDIGGVYVVIISWYKFFCFFPSLGGRHCGRRGALFRHG
jgi:hypothetical protein